MENKKETPIYTGVISRLYTPEEENVIKFGLLYFTGDIYPKKQHSLSITYKHEYDRKFLITEQGSF